MTKRAPILVLEPIRRLWSRRTRTLLVMCATIAALLSSQFALAMTAEPPPTWSSAAAAPCHENLSHAGPSDDPSGIPPDQDREQPCPMMAGATCASLCAALGASPGTVPDVVTLPDRARSLVQLIRAWAVAPPDRPPIPL